VICSSASFDFVLSKVILNTNISNYIIKVTLCLSNDSNPKTLISLRKGWLYTKLANFAQTRQNKECVRLWPCYLHLKSILRQKKNYENSHISPCKIIIFKKSSKTNQNPPRFYNTITNLKFQRKPKYPLSKILI